MIFFLGQEREEEKGTIVKNIQDKDYKEMCFNAKVREGIRKGTQRKAHIIFFLGQEREEDFR